MNSFQSTAINANFFNATVSSSRLAFGSSATNARAPVNDSSVLDANGVALERIRDLLENQGIRLNPNAQPRSVTDVAAQVLSRVNAAVDAEPDDAARIALLEKAAEGIAQGISEARQILDQAGVLNGKLAETVDAIAEQLQVGLQSSVSNIVSAVQVNRAVAPVSSVPVSAQRDPVPVASSQVSIGAGVLVQRSASISIETQDGDVITLDFNRSQAAAVAIEAQASSEGISASFTTARVVSSNLNYSVQGELDAGEVEALDELLGKISKVADKFFGGQIAAAFEKASQLELDTEELSSYSVALESVAVQQVVSRYQQVAELGNASAATSDANRGSVSAASPVAPVEPNTATPSIADAAAAVGEIAQVVDFAAKQRVIANPQTDVPNLLETVARAKGFEAPSNSPVVQSFSEVLGLLRDLIADLALPAATGDTTSNEAKHHDEHEESRDDE